MGQMAFRMPTLGWVVALVAMLALAGCDMFAPPSKFRVYDGPEVTRLSVHKSSRKLKLWHHDELLRSFDVDLGWAPEGHKSFEGDGRTPEGRYYIDRRNPDSSFHLSLGISYPNPADIEHARKSGKSPGGDIFIHGQPNILGRFGKKDDPDWTAGCIAVKNKHMELVYAMVQTGTVIDIYP